MTKDMRGIVMGTKDHPFDECAAAAEDLCNKGWDVYQKFTCANCGQRLTMDVPNQFFETGDCDKCGHVTNIRERGCNYMIHMRLVHHE